MDGFAVQPLSQVAAELAVACSISEVGAEHLVLIADRPGPAPPYALPIDIPEPGHALREKGLQLLFARAVTVAAAIVGTSRLRLVTEREETFAWLRGEFVRQRSVAEHLAQYGETFSLERGRPEDVPAELRAMPFRSSSSSSSPPAGDPDRASSQEGGALRLFVGVDYGRSDVKCAAVDEQGEELSAHVTRWWRPSAAGGGEGGAEGGDREYLDPAALLKVAEPLRCLGDAAAEAIRKAIAKRTADAGGTAPTSVVVCGLGLSAAGCVRDGRLCGVPPALAGCASDPSAPAVLARLEHAVLEDLAERLPSIAPSATIGAGCSTLLVNDGDASALWGAKGLAGQTGSGGSPVIGLFLSCGTGLAGGIVRADGAVCSGGVLELGKLVVGLPIEGGGSAGAVPVHDTLQVPGVAQGLAGTQRSFFNLVAARGGERIEGKAEQRAAIIAMQKREPDDEVVAIFRSLGKWLAQFAVELAEYLPFDLSLVEAGGKLTDAKSGELMLRHAAEALASSTRFAGRPPPEVRRANESEFGQALAVALSVRP